MRLLNHLGNEFCIAHFQGKTYRWFPDLLKHINRQKVTLPDNVEIVTVSNRSGTSMLISQLKKNNIPYINKVPEGCYWNNLKKIGYINEALLEVKSKYVLILDADDVLITRTASEIVKRLNKYKKQILFNADKYNYPDMLIDKIPDRDFMGQYRYLNAGACFGLLESCREFYRKADEILSNGNIYNPSNSEQFIIRHAFKDATDIVGFDYECNLFQTFIGATVRDLGNKRYMIV